MAALAAALAGGFAPAARGATSSDLNRGVVDITSRLALEDGSSAGTGMLIASGVVLTNNHVIEGAGSIVVTDVTTSRRYRAGVVGYDLVDDVAVLRLRTAPRLGTVSLGDSSTVRVGDRVTAVGNAGGQGGTPTASTGKVTHLNRAITISEPSTGRSEHLTGLIQIDAALHAGDSGGPLFNSAGRVIGMNTAASVSFRFRGVPTSEGYAIPINTAMTVARPIPREVADGALPRDAAPSPGRPREGRVDHAVRRPGGRHRASRHRPTRMTDPQGPRPAAGGPGGGRH